MNDIEFLKSSIDEGIKVQIVRTQALIHSNLFDACMGTHNVLQTHTLAEMVHRNYKKPFVCYIDREKGKKYFGVIKYFSD